jgi:hypothetical protein
VRGDPLAPERRANVVDGDGNTLFRDLPWTLAQQIARMIGPPKNTTFKGGALVEEVRG